MSRILSEVAELIGERREVRVRGLEFGRSFEPRFKVPETFQGRTG